MLMMIEFFNNAIIRSIFESKAVNFLHPFHEKRIQNMSANLFARMLLVQTQLHPGRNRITSAISKAWQVIRETSERAEEQRLAVCAAAARHLRWKALDCYVSQAELTDDDGYIRQHLISGAVIVGDVPMVKHLLAKGVDPNEENGYFGQPLQLAAATGQLELVRVLLEAGADARGFGNHYTHLRNGRPALQKPSQATVYGLSPLEQATLTDDRDIIQALEANSTEWSHEEYFRAACTAAMSGYARLVPYFAGKAGRDFDCVSNEHYTWFWEACRYGRDEVIRVMLDCGVDVNTKRKESIEYASALHLAAIHGYTDTIQLLLNKGADKYCKDPHLGTAINVAVSQGHEEAVQVFLDHGIDINDPSNHSLLCTAAENGQTHMIRFLIQHGADINTRFENSFTAGQLALSGAVLRGMDQVVHLLVEIGASLNDHHDLDHPIVLAAKMCGRDYIAETLVQLGAQDVDPLSSEAEHFQNGAYPMKPNNITKETCNWFGKY